MVVFFGSGFWRWGLCKDQQLVGSCVEPLVSEGSKGLLKDCVPMVGEVLSMYVGR